MKRMLQAALVAAAFLTLSPAQSGAESFQNGFVNSEGYAYQDGFWHKGGQAYNRVLTKYWDPYGSYAYDYYGRGYWAGVWKSYYKYDLAPKVVIQPQSEDQWRARLLEIGKQRDKWEGQARASMLEHSEFLETIKVMGLEGNFRWNGYGYELNPSQGLGQYGQGYQQAAGYNQLVAPQGATIYGYKESADVYGNVDVGELYNSVFRLREQSYANESKATSETHQLVDNIGQRRADLLDKQAAVEEIRAKAAAARELLAMLTPEKRQSLQREFRVETRGSYSQTGSPQPQPQPQPGGGQGGQGGQAGGAWLAAAQQVVRDRCVSCHDKQGPRGGLDLSDLSQLDDAQAAMVLTRVIHTDPAKRMPVKAQGDDYVPGVPLTSDETAVLFLALYQPLAGM